MLVAPTLKRGNPQRLGNPAATYPSGSRPLASTAPPLSSFSYRQKSSRCLPDSPHENSTQLKPVLTNILSRRVKESLRVPSLRAQPYCCTERHCRRAGTSRPDDTTYPGCQPRGQGRTPLRTRTWATKREGPGKRRGATEVHTSGDETGAEEARVRARRRRLTSRRRRF